MTIILSQGEFEDFDCVGFYVLRSKDPSRKLPRVIAGDLVHKTEFVSPKEAAAVVALSKGDVAVVLPCTFDPGREAFFKLSLLSLSHIKVRELKDERRQASYAGEWRPETAGGSLDSPAWRLNPQCARLAGSALSRLPRPILARAGTSFWRTTRRRSASRFGSGRRRPRRRSRPWASTCCGPAAARSGATRSARATSWRRRPSRPRPPSRSTSSCPSTPSPVRLLRAVAVVVVAPLTPALSDVVMPCTAGVSARYTLTVENRAENAASRGFTFLGCNYGWQKRTARGEWRGDSAAGDIAGGKARCLVVFPRRRSRLGTRRAGPRTRSSRSTCARSARASPSCCRRRPWRRPATASISSTPPPTRPSRRRSATPTTRRRAPATKVRAVCRRLGGARAKADGGAVTLERDLPGGYYTLVAFGPKGKEAAFELSVYAARRDVELEAAGRDLLKRTAPGPKKDKLYTIELGELALKDKIGQGALGVVYRGIFASRPVAVKRVAVGDAADREYLKKEVAILRRAKHACVASFEGACVLEVRPRRGAARCGARGRCAGRRRTTPCWCTSSPRAGRCARCSAPARR